ncbi:MAG: trehalose-phosphatase [Pseudorhodoplanes sp.]|nr:trehalose-phosphatase [Pseudorhodoplanes sp.]
MKTDVTPSDDTHAVPLVSLDNVAVFLDVDGTLLDFAARPDEVIVPKSLQQTLERLARKLDGAVAFISGRPLADIDRIFAPLRFPAVGGHGAEIRVPESDGLNHHGSVPFDRTLKKQFYDLTQLGAGIVIEDKGYSIAVHYRLAPDLGSLVAAAITDIWAKSGKRSFEILPGKFVLEVKPRGFDKGTGLREMMGYAPFAGRRPIFIGDDTTDRAAFAVLPDYDGIGFSVGGIVPGASYNFDGPKDVRLWLERMSKGARPHGTIKDVNEEVR